MKSLTNENVEYYYKYVNDLLGKASVSNVKVEDIDLFCFNLKKQIDQLCENIKHHLRLNPADSAIFVLDLGSELAPKEASKYLEKRTEEGCGISYDQGSNEYLIWI